MLRTRSAIGSVLVVVAVALVGAGCGGGDDSGSPFEPAAADDTSQPSDAASADDTTAADSEASSDSVSDSDAGSAVASSGGGGPQLSEGSWEGPAHFEISGDVDVSRDLFGAGLTQGDYTLLTFTSDDGAGTQIGFTGGSDEQAAVFVTSNDFTGGGEIGDGKECTITMTKNDDSAAEGRFSCKGVKGVSVANTKDYTVDIEGTFTMARP